MGIEKLKKMLDRACWHVSAGGSTWPSFVLVMGDKVRRMSPLKNPAQPEDYRQFRGSLELLVWSSWRLQTRTEVLATSDQDDDVVGQLESLNGIKIVGVSYSEPAWDLRIDFADGRELLTFSDHLEPGASIPENWELTVDGCRLSAGPGHQLHEEPSQIS